MIISQLFYFYCYEGPSGLLDKGVNEGLLPDCNVGLE